MSLELVLSQLGTDTAPALIALLAMGRIDVLRATKTPVKGGELSSFAASASDVPVVFKNRAPKDAEREAAGGEERPLTIYEFTAGGLLDVVEEDRVLLKPHGAVTDAREMEVLSVTNPSGVVTLIVAAWERPTE